MERERKQGNSSSLFSPSFAAFFLPESPFKKKKKHFPKNAPLHAKHAHTCSPSITRARRDDVTTTIDEEEKRKREKERERERNIERVFFFLCCSSSSFFPSPPFLLSKIVRALVRVLLISLLFLCCLSPLVLKG